jgi:hypothetical protein
MFECEIGLRVPRLAVVVLVVLGRISVVVVWFNRFFESLPVGAIVELLNGVTVARGSVTKGALVVVPEVSSMLSVIELVVELIVVVGVVFVESVRALGVVVSAVPVACVVIFLPYSSCSPSSSS